MCAKGTYSLWGVFGEGGGEYRRSTRSTAWRCISVSVLSSTAGLPPIPAGLVQLTGTRAKCLAWPIPVRWLRRDTSLALGCVPTTLASSVLRASLLGSWPRLFPASGPLCHSTWSLGGVLRPPLSGAGLVGGCKRVGRREGGRGRGMWRFLVRLAIPIAGTPLAPAALGECPGGAPRAALFMLLNAPPWGALPVPCQRAESHHPRTHHCPFGPHFHLLPPIYLSISGGRVTTSPRSPPHIPFPLSIPPPSSLFPFTRLCVHRHGPHQTAPPPYSQWQRQWPAPPCG